MHVKHLPQSRPALGRRALKLLCTGSGQSLTDRCPLGRVTSSALPVRQVYGSSLQFQGQEAESHMQTPAVTNVQGFPEMGVARSRPALAPVRGTLSPCSVPFLCWLSLQSGNQSHVWFKKKRAMGLTLVEAEWNCNSQDNKSCRCCLFSSELWESVV